MPPSTIACSDRLIVALDLPGTAAAEAMIARLGDSVTFYKIGYQLAYSGGLLLVRRPRRDIPDRARLSADHEGGGRSACGIGPENPRRHGADLLRRRRSPCRRLSAFGV